MTETVREVELSGSVERVTYANPSTGFAVVRARVRGRREPIAVVGTLPAVQPGERLHLTGTWQIDRQHGEQFRATTARAEPPSTREDIIRYLGSGLVRDLGPVLAERIVKHFGEETLVTLDSEPTRVREVPGIGPRRAASLVAAWAEHRALRAVMAFLAEHQLDTRYAARLVARYGGDAAATVSANPYRLVADVPGFGFAAADRLGRDLAIRTSAPARLQAAVHAALLRAAENGHTRLDRADLVRAATRLAEVEPALIESAVAQLAAGGTISAGRSIGTTAPADVAPPPTAEPATVDGGGRRLRIYTPPVAAMPDDASENLGLAGLVRAEERLAASLSRLGQRLGTVPPDAIDRWLAEDSEAATLSDEQRDAVRGAVLSGCFVLTGGPGVGKTTTLRALVRCFQALGRSVGLAAPTGKAARRLGEVVGIEARTIHRMLGADPRGFRHGPREPLPFDVVIVDEASMLDTTLAAAVASAVAQGSQLILVGDADQLPSVGPGQVLRDVIASGLVPTARLERIFRQAALSQIVTHAHEIRRGEVPAIAPVRGLREGIDCVFVEAGPARLPELATEWAARHLPRHLGVPAHEVQVLAPLTRVTQAVNGLLQAQLNPSNGQNERPHGALALRQGDRVIQTRNNYLLGVFNGDTGTIASVESDEVTIDFGDDRRIAYRAADLLDIEHAYCLTVHRAQGSEWPGIVLLLSSDYGVMLSRNLLYTGLTRARRAAVVIGDRAAIAQAVAVDRDSRRRTALADLLRAATLGTS